MSTTRHSANPDEFNQQGWCSAPEYNFRLNAQAVAKRVQLLRTPELKALVWFLQWRSLEPDGLEQVAKELLTFKERIGTATMRKLGCAPDRIYCAREVKQIRAEIPGGDQMFLIGDEHAFSARDLIGLDRDEEPQEQHPITYKASAFLAAIRDESQNLAEHLARMCVDPSIDFSGKVWWFDDLTGALLKLRADFMARASRCLARTEVSGSILEALDFALRQRRMVLIEGNPGLGKSVTMRAFCEMSGGLARYVEVPEGSDERSFYARIGAALGVACGASYSGIQIKTRVESVLTASGLRIVLDEAARLWPQFYRPKGQPHRMLWTMSMHEAGVCVALSGFKFSDWRNLYCEKTNWPDEQFERRLNRTVNLPAVHPEADLLLIAKAILPNACKASIKLLMGIARVQPRKGASAMVEVIHTARDIVETEGLPEISFDVVQRAVAINHPEMSGAVLAPRAADPLIGHFERGNLSEHVPST